MATKTVISRRFKEFSFLDYGGDLFRGGLWNEDFIFNVKMGNLLKNSGDILLCPISEGFSPSNPLSREIIRNEGKWLKDKIEALYTSETAKWIGSEHVAFLPCRKLKYRGILFVCVDFYSENRTEINAARIAEALAVARRYGCAKLTCPQNILYRRDNSDELIFHLRDMLYYLLEQWSGILRNTHNDFKVDFMVEILLKNSIANYCLNQEEYWPDNPKTIMVEYFSKCSAILPHYWKKLKQIGRRFIHHNLPARQIRRALTEFVQEKEIKRLLQKLIKILGLSFEVVSTGIGNTGGIRYFLLQCPEMPWTLLEIKGTINDFLLENEYTIDGSRESVEEFFSDLTIFEFQTKKNDNQPCML